MAKSTPKAPNYEAAAEAQAQGSREVTEQQTWANRPDQFTPFGQQTWENTPQVDPATGQTLNRWAQTTQLTPESQRALDAQLGLTAGRSELGESLLPRAQDEFSETVDWNQFDPGGGPINPGDIQRGLSTEGLTNIDPAQRYYDEAGDAIYRQWEDRALPQQARDTDALRTQLYNMGHREGDPGYDEALRKLRETQGDQQSQAAYRATIGAGEEASRYRTMDASTRAQMFGERGTQGTFANDAQEQDFGQQLTGGGYATQQRQQQITEELTRRGFTLNEINALLTGQQVGMPSMPGFNTAQRAEGVQALSAAQMTGQAELDRYNAQQQALQGMMSGIGSLGSAFMPV